MFVERLTLSFRQTDGDCLEFSCMALLGVTDYLRLQLQDGLAIE